MTIQCFVKHTSFMTAVSVAGCVASFTMTVESPLVFSSRFTCLGTNAPVKKNLRPRRDGKLMGTLHAGLGGRVREEVTYGPEVLPSGKAW